MKSRMKRNCLSCVECFKKIYNNRNFELYLAVLMAYIKHSSNVLWSPCCFQTLIIQGNCYFQLLAVAKWANNKRTRKKVVAQLMCFGWMDG
jgi:hypothetical protein